MRQLPVSDTWQTGGKVCPDVPPLEQIAQKQTQYRNRMLGVIAANAPLFSKNEAMQVARSQLIKTQRAILESLR